MKTSAAPIHDLQQHLGTLDDREQQQIAAAGVVIDIAMLLHTLRTQRGLSQADVAKRLGTTQQAVSHMERAHPNYSITTLCRYLSALGYGFDLVVVDPQTDELIDEVAFRPHHRADANGSN